MSSSRSSLINSPNRIFDHSTIHGRIHSCLYRMPWNLILPLSALAFIVFVSAVSIRTGLEHAELYQRSLTSTTAAPPILNSTFEDDADNVTLSF